ncbi:GNAT family N-acetyltransferase [Psychromarinibacter sp. C21-152]|uniref:GNAT family N-acetyltransferase n=1 Tax=Psychromarinibacter sediminicola TaxID=3033385 RepID=A0AAE3T722_9RHOB|nr:GNAT family N-acetyltransferase [Psychromarinibacter sediminicola]MDF0599872.1 GNAT family N-acetyltransferase [Psychromarinibacter sediminicola]
MPDTLTIRVAEPSDLLALDALFGRAYPRLLKADYPPSVLVTALPLISKAQPQLLRSGTFYVAETGTGWLVGAGGWTPRRGGGIGDIRHVVTDDRQTRRGVGRAILTRVIADATAAGLRLLDCKATRTAVPFYRAMGFAEDGEITVSLRPGIDFPAIHMTRPL